LVEFMLQLGQAYLAAGEQTAKVEIILRRMAAAYGASRSQVIVFPTAVFLSLNYGEQQQVALAEGPTQRVRLDQIADVYRLGDEAQAGQVAPPGGLQRLSEILRKPARFGVVGRVTGHIVLSVGLAMVLMPAVANLAAAAVLGAVVGLLKAVNRDRPLLSIPLPVVAAALVSAVAFLALNRGLPVDPLHVLVPPLVTYLPGVMLTLAMVELAYGDMVSGASRLITGFVALVLLAFGLAAGALLAGYRPENLIDASRVAIEGPWAQLAVWSGVIVFGVGAYVHFSAPENSLVWMLLVMLCAFAAQKASAGIVGREVSGFVGMLVATPLSYLIQQHLKGPPAMVTLLPGFWILVPGALSLVSVKQMLSDRAAGIDGMVTAVFALVSIALGTLMGASLYKGLTEAPGRWRDRRGGASRTFPSDLN
jgi:uncharacterized membrane protein YjjP (DUF1212 family)